uniref:Uncharacterized protein n=1 Tax=Oryza sativa subsp. japonica TaxID=39947 RepID=Q8LH75_ORYSJ|nr:hypothetical protein [Oryza sativa Japonica Group]BAC16108.1 hypothetical protein [Oryza sativa Japonica Group]
MAGKMKQQLGGEMEIDQLRVRDDLEEEEEDEMSWMARKLFLYNVTIGLYGLDCLYGVKGCPSWPTETRTNRRAFTQRGPSGCSYDDIYLL